MDPCKISEDQRGFLGIFEDVTDIKRSEEAARESLERNRALLAELHHRVKNSLQLILSLINLQSYRLSDKEAAEAMRSLQRRIKSIAIIHEILLSRGMLMSWISGTTPSGLHHTSRTFTVQMQGSWLMSLNLHLTLRPRFPLESYG